MPSKHMQIFKNNDRYGGFSFVLLPGFVGLRKIYVFIRFHSFYFYFFIFQKKSLNEYFIIFMFWKIVLFLVFWALCGPLVVAIVLIARNCVELSSSELCKPNLAKCVFVAVFFLNPTVPYVPTADDAK